jgi:hypothetical protein
MLKFVRSFTQKSGFSVVAISLKSLMLANRGKRVYSNHMIEYERQAVDSELEKLGRIISCWGDTGEADNSAVEAMRTKKMEEARSLAEHLIYHAAPGLGLELQIDVGERPLGAYKFVKDSESNGRVEHIELDAGSVLPVRKVKHLPGIEEEGRDMYIGDSTDYIPLGSIAVALGQHGELSFAEIETQPAKQYAA